MFITIGNKTWEDVEVVDMTTFQRITLSAGLVLNFDNCYIKSLLQVEETDIITSCCKPNGCRSVVFCLFPGLDTCEVNGNKLDNGLIESCGSKYIIISGELDGYVYDGVFVDGVLFSEEYEMTIHAQPPTLIELRAHLSPDDK